MGNFIFIFSQNLNFPLGNFVLKSFFRFSIFKSLIKKFWIYPFKGTKKILMENFRANSWPMTYDLWPMTLYHNLYCYFIVNLFHCLSVCMISSDRMAQWIELILERRCCDFNPGRSQPFLEKSVGGASHSHCFFRRMTSWQNLANPIN